MKQPEALLLADSLDSYGLPWDSPSAMAAAELRRLHALNAELVAALAGAVDQCIWPNASFSSAEDRARAALTKAGAHQ